MSRIAPRVLLTLSLCVLLFANAGDALADCFLTPDTPTNIAGDLNTDLNDWAWILNDSIEPACDSRVTADIFLKKLKEQERVGGWSGFLRGGAVSFAYATGIALNNRAATVPAAMLAEINDYLQNKVGYQFQLDGTNASDSEPDCGLTGTFGLYRDDLGGGPIERWRLGNSCMDDYVVGAEAFAWRAAYKRRIGDASGYGQDRQEMIDKIVAMFGPESICIYDKTKPLDPANGPCNTNNLDDLEASLNNRDEVVSVLALNHSQENPSYGIGLITSLTHSFAAMQAAGTPLDRNSFGAGSRRIQLVLRALFQEGQRTARSAVEWESLCYYPPDDPRHHISKTHTAFTYFLDEDILAEDARKRTCIDRLFNYSPWMFPVLGFYEKYDFATGLDDDRFAFEGAAFETHGSSVFSPEELHKRTAFFGLGRRLVYYGVTHDWTVNGLPGLLCTREVAFTGPTTIVPGGRAMIAATPIAGLSYQWSIENGTISSTSGPNVFIVAGSSGAVTLTLKVTGGGLCGSSSTQTKTIAIQGRAQSWLFMDSVNASAGVPETIRVTLNSDAGPLENQELVFTVLNNEIGRARTDSEGRASLVYTPNVAPGTYQDGVRVSYAGTDLVAPSQTSGSLSVSCDVPAYAAVPTAVNFTKAGGSVAVTVTAFSMCGWTAELQGSAPWLQLRSAGPHLGTDTFTIEVGALPAAELSRTATVIAGFQRITVQQTQNCSARLDPSLVYLPASGPLGTTEVTTLDVAAPRDCAWTVVSNDAWLHLVTRNPRPDNDPGTNDEWLNVNEVTGTSTGTVTFRADNNGDSDRRRGRLTVTAGGTSASASVNQYGKPVCVAPHIRVEPMDGAVKNGQSIATRVYATGTELRYQWRASGELFGVNAGPSIIIPFDHHWYPEKGTSKFYSVTVSNECGSDGASARWSVSNDELTCRPPFISDHPDSQSSPFPGARVRLSVSADHWDGSGAFHYQWYAGMTGEKTSPIGEDKPFVDVFPHETSFYWVEVSDSCGAQNSGTAVVLTTLPPRMRVAPKSFVGDGTADLVWHNPTTKQNELWWMSGTSLNFSPFPLPQHDDPGARIQSIGDFNGDERPDLVWRNPQTGQNSIWLMDGRFRSGQQTLESKPGAGWSIGAVADLDNDENHDIVWHNDSTGENEIWFQSGNQHQGTFALPPTPDANWGLHGTANFTSDDKPDLFFHNRVTGENSVWVMNDERRAGVTADAAGARPRPRFRITTHAVPSQPDTNWVPALIGDMNSDGRADIIWRNVATGANQVWLMSGTTLVSTHPVTAQPDLSWEIGGGGSTNGNGGEGGDDTRTATASSVSATTAPYGKATTITATLTSDGAPLSSQPVVFLLNNSEVARLLTDAGGTAVAGVSVAGLPSGTHPGALAVRFEGDARYAPSQAATTLVISAQQPVITWSNPAPIVYGTPLSATQLNATANVAGSFAYSHAAGAVLDAGYHAITATFTPADPSLATASTTVVLLVEKAPVSVSWPSPAPIAYGTPLSATQLAATASVAGSFVYTPPAGTVLGLGTHTLTATFVPAAPNYTSTPVSTTLTVIQGTQTLSWSNPAPIVYGQALSAVQLNAVVSASGAAPAGALTYSPAAGTILPAGTHTLTVSAAATQFYTASSTSVQIVVMPRAAVITWTQPAAIVYGTALGAAQLDATADVPGTFAYTPAAGTVLQAGAAQTLTVQFTPSDANNHLPASKSVTIDVLKAKPVLAWAQPAAIVYGTPLSATQLNATADVAGSFLYSPPAGTILDAGAAQTLSVQFTPADVRNYESAAASVKLDVAKAKQTLTWAQPAPIVYRTPLSSAQLQANVSVVGPAPAGALTYAPAAGTVLEAGTHTLTVTAAATPNYESATTSVTLEVRKAKPVLTWAQPAAIVYGTPLSGAQLDATADVPGTFTYTPAAGTILQAGVETLTAHFTPADTRNFETATATVALEIQRATPVLTWAGPASIVYGTALSATQLNATADVPGTFTYTPAGGTILDAGAGQTLRVHFAPEDTRNYNDAGASATIDVAKAKQTLSWNAPAPVVYGTALSSLQLDARVAVVGPAAAGALVYTPAAGTVLDAGMHTLAVTARETNNYESATLSVPLEVRRAPLSLVVDAKAKLYGGLVPALTGTLTGAVNGDPITPTYATPATQQSNTGVYPITGSLLDPANRLVNYDVTIANATLTVHPAPLLIAADPAAKQYSDPLPQLTATFTGLVLGETPAVLGGILVIETTATPLSAPGPYPIRIGGLTSSNYTIVYAGSTLTVTQEDARVAIISPLVVSGTRATLIATVRDVEDGSAGDIRNATLAFVDRATNATLCTAPIGLAVAEDPRVGVATCTFVPSGASVVVGARVGGYYTRDDAAEDVTLAVVAATTDSITGGGATAGGSFNVNLQYEKNGSVKGGLKFTFTRDQRTYEIAAATVDSLAVRRTAGGGNVAITGTAVLRDVTTPTAPVVVDGAAPLVVTATDDGEPSARDSLSVLLLRTGGGYWLATGWDGGRATEQPLTKGNLAVHYGK